MPEPIKKDGESTVVPPATKETTEPVAPVATAPSQGKKTKLEKLEYTKASLERQIQEEKKLSGITEVESDLDDNTPITRGDLKRIEQEKATRTALSMADAIEDEAEREEVKDILQNRIVPSGDSDKDYNFALGAVRAEKTRQVASERARKIQGSRTPSGGGNPPPIAEDQFTPTAEELQAVRMGKVPADKMKDWILNVRKEIAQASS